MRLSKRNLRLCVLRRFLDRSECVAEIPVVRPGALREAATDIELLDATLGQNLQLAFRDRKHPMPVDEAMEIIDLWMRDALGGLP